MSTDKIDSIIDIKAVQAELDSTKSGINELVALIQSVKGKAVEITGAKSVTELKGLSKELDLLIKQTNLSSKAAIDDAKARDINAKAALNEAKAVEVDSKAKINDAKAAIESSKANLNNAKASIENAKAKTEDSKATNEISKANLNNAKATTESSRAKVEDAKATNENSKATLNNAKAKTEDAKATTENAKAKTEEAKQKDINARIAAREAAAADKLAKAKAKEEEATRKSLSAYTQLAMRFKIASDKAKDLGAQYGTLDKRSQAAAKEANQLNNELKKIDASVGNFQRNVGNYPKGFDKISSSISNLTTNFLSLIGVVGIGSIFSSSIDEFIEMDKNVRLLQNTLKNLGVPEAFDRISSSADKLQKQFKFLDNDEILKSFNQLIVYGKLTEEQINDLIPVIINFSAATGQTLEAATSTIIKSLEGNGKALKEFGINMKDAKTTGEAFGLVMTELAPKVDGVAKAFGDSAAGGLASAKQEFKDLKEELGSGLLPILNSVLNLLLRVGSNLKTFYKAVKEAVGGGTGFFAINEDEILKDENFNNTVAELTKQRIGAYDNMQKEVEKSLGRKLDLKNNKEDQKLLSDTQDKVLQGYLATAKNARARIELLKKDFKNTSEDGQDLRTQMISLRASLDAIDQINAKKSTGVLGLGQADSRDTDAAKKAAEERKKKEADEIKAAEERAERIRKAVFETNKSILQDQIKQNEDIFKDDKKSEEERLQALRQFIQDKAALVELERTFEKGAKGILKEEIITIEQNKTNDINELVRNGHREYEKILEDSAKRQQEIEKDNADRIKKIHEDLQKDIDKGLDEANERLKKKIKEREDFEKERGQLREQLAKEVEGFLFDIAFNNIDKEKNAIQDQIDLLEVKKQKDIEVANATITNAQDKAAAITTIEARADAEHQALERKQRQLDIQRARFEKAQNIVNIISETALAVVRTLGAKPWTPANIALAALVGSIGAVQAARAAAQPIPRFKDGGEVKDTGLIMVGDGGKHEGVKLPDGTLMKTPNVNTLMYAEKGTKIFPDYNKMMFKATLTDVPKWSSPKVTSDTSTPIIVASLNKVEKAIRRIPQTQFVVDNIISKKVRQG